MEGRFFMCQCRQTQILFSSHCTAVWLDLWFVNYFTETPGGPCVLHCQRTADDRENLQERPGGHHYGNDNEVITMVMSLRLSLWKWQWGYHYGNVNEVITMVMWMRLSIWLSQWGHHDGYVNEVITMLMSMRHHYVNDNEVITMVMSMRSSVLIYYHIMLMVLLWWWQLNHHYCINTEISLKLYL